MHLISASVGSDDKAVTILMQPPGDIEMAASELATVAAGGERSEFSWGPAAQHASSHASHTTHSHQSKGLEELRARKIWRSLLWTNATFGTLRFDADRDESTRTRDALMHTSPGAV